MFIKNTTTIPNALVHAIYLAVKPDNTSITHLHLRCKERNKVHGNWGKFYATEDKITLCVPNADIAHSGTNIAIHGYSSITPYGKLARNIIDLTEWLAITIGHEMKHKWQYVNLPRTVYDVIPYIEVDAEMYESVALEKWRSFLKGE